MQVKRSEGKDERTILIAMIVNKAVLGSIAVRWPKQGLFSSEWSNLVGQWCVNHYNKYKKPPGKDIEGLFEAWAQGHKRDKETTSLLDKFLSSLSGEYATHKEGINPEYVLDLAATYFNKVKLKTLATEIEESLEDGKVEDAEKLVTQFNRIDIGAGVGIDLFHNLESIQQAFDENREALIEYPGALGVFFGEFLERDGFIAFMGPEKRGKTWMLLDVAWRAMLQRRRVAFFEVGDMSKDQITRRFMVRASAHPLAAGKVRYPRKIILAEDADMAEVEFEEKVFEQDLDWRGAWKACQETMEKKVRSKESLFKLSIHPNSSINIHGIQSICDTWEREGWVPDVIVIDYADILAPPTGVAESRDQINATWKGLRSLSQSLHCLVVTATQSDTDSYSALTITRKNFSEDKRKLAHVTGMVGLNATPDEEEQGLMRLNWVALREGQFSERRCVHVAKCLELANPTVRSVM